jgi:predicted RNA binding protein YcfA (HicA-like mRNA interferase family)
MMAWTGAELLALLRHLGCEAVRQRGSHVRVKCGTCYTTVPVHSGQTLPPGTLARIRRDLEPCLGEGWLK